MPHLSEANEKSDDNDKELTKYENTYRLEPCKPFQIDEVDKIVRLVMVNSFEDVTYNSMECAKLCNTIASDIQRRIKSRNFCRHKIVVVVTIIEKASQSLETALGFLWDKAKDNYSTFTFETQTLYASCCVFGLYYE